MSASNKILQAAAGNAGGDNLYVEDVFSTYLYDGTGAAHTITNGIDLAGEGGLTWIKTRNTGTSAWHSLSDTERGAGNILRSDLTNAQNFDTAEFTSFNSDGFTVGNDAQTNGSGRTYASWTFRKAPKFFDVVTYTGNSAVRNIAHNLGSTPAFIVIKRTDGGTEGWNCYHESLGNNALVYLNTTDAQFTPNSNWNTTSPTDSVFTVSGNSSVNFSGATYVAYLFASDAGGFGDDGSESIIKCGVLTSTSSGFVDVDCGFEVQWLLIKGTMTNNWQLFDNMRGVYLGNGHNRLFANTSGAENDSSSDAIHFTATGFKANTFDGGFNGAGDYVYIAIRRPMKTPESATEVFNVVARSGTGSSPTVVDNGFTADMVLYREREEGYDPFGFRIQDRFRGWDFLEVFSTDAEANFVSDDPFNDRQNSIAWNSNSYHVNDTQGTYVFNSFKRATGFFDVVAYTGVDANDTQITHNLGVVPEMIWAKCRSSAGQQWSVLTYDGATGTALRLDATNSGSSPPAGNIWGDGSSFVAPTSSVFTIGDYSNINTSGATYIAYLFATVDGISKVGSYSGTGSNVNVDCGFSAGARFILIKRTDSTGDWYVWDSVRGIVAGNDPYLLLNSIAAEVTTTDYIDPLASGFTVTSTAPAALNASGGSYIFLAIS